MKRLHLTVEVDEHHQGANPYFVEHILSRLTWTGDQDEVRQGMHDIAALLHLGCARVVAAEVEVPVFTQDEMDQHKRERLLREQGKD